MSHIFLQRATVLALLFASGLSQAHQSWWDKQKDSPVESSSQGALVSTAGSTGLQNHEQSAPSAATAPIKITIPEGTDVRLRMLDKLSSSTATEGQRFNLELEEDIQINGLTVVPHGAKAVGTVVSAKKKGFMGRGGDLNILVDYLLYKDQRIRLRAGSGREGKDKVGTAVTLTVLFGPLGLLKRGHDAEINPGAILNAYVDQAAEVIL